LAFVRRELPDAYLPGTIVEVRLRADPPGDAAAWTVEDLPPAGWLVTEISDEGAFDAPHGKVKFGPFLDGRERILSYRVTAAADASGPQKFAGSSSLNGRTLPVTGDDTLEPAGEYHPADGSPQDRNITANEITAYAAAWKTGKGSVPVTYVTRAGQIWKAGESYVFDPTQGAPPECWVPAPAKSPALAGVSASGTGGAERRTPGVWKPGRSGKVEIRVTPPVGAAAVAVEEAVPAGWQVSRISDGGVFDAESRRVRWGLFFGDDTRRLTYELTPPAGAASAERLKGVASFDGDLIVIDGEWSAGAVDETTELRMIGPRRNAYGRMRFQVQAPLDQAFVVESSTDLQRWSEVEAYVFTGEELEVEERAESAGAAAARYFRLRPLGR
jgi:hypothetical protein